MKLLFEALISCAVLITVGSNNSRVIGELACSINGIENGAEIAVAPEISVGSKRVLLDCTFRQFETQSEEQYLGTLQSVDSLFQNPTPETLLWIVKTDSVASVKAGMLSQGFEVDGTQGDEKAIALKGDTESNVSLILAVAGSSKRKTPPSVVSLKLLLTSAAI
jgi:hypothetical protein